MNYDVNNLSMGIVKIYQNNSKTYELHVLYNDMDSEELMDLNLDKPILPYGSEEKYYKRSLVPFNEILSKSGINYGHLNHEDALRIGNYYDGHYFKMLRYRHIYSIDDLKEPVIQKKKKRR